MARTRRTVPHWINSSTNAEWAESKYFRRAAQGRDGAIRSENAQSAKAGKRDNWSTAAKGRNNKRVATKQIRAFLKAETVKEIENSDNFSLDEYNEACKENEILARLACGLYWAKEDAEIAARDLAFYREQIERLREEIAEIKGAKAP